MEIRFVILNEESFIILAYKFYKCHNYYSKPFEIYLMLSLLKLAQNVGHNLSYGNTRRQNKIKKKKKKKEKKKKIRNMMKYS